MLDLIQITDINYCNDLLPIINLVKIVYGLVQFAIPLLLIIFGTLDLGKAVISSDDKEVKAAQSRFIKRCIYAVAIFFVVLIVSLIMKAVGQSQQGSKDGGDTESWYTCWSKKAQK